MNENAPLHPLADSLWVGAARECVSPVIFRHFSAKNIRNATLYVTGLGYFEAKVNDCPVTEDRFLPLVTDYEERELSKFRYPLFDNPTHRIYYCTFDVTAFLRTGENTLSIQLGNGWYRQTERIAEGNVSFSDDLKAIYSLVLETDDGPVVLHSDGSEVWTPSEIVYNNLFIGEVIDPAAARGSEQPVRILPSPASLLCPQIGTADRLIRTILPSYIGSCDGKQIYDTGENISGVVRVHTAAPAGTKITLRFAENLNTDLSLNFSSTGCRYICSTGRNQIMEDTFISDGTSRSYEPKFTWHAFRYFEVDGPIDDVQVLVIHSNTPVICRFDSSSEGLNYLYETYLRTQLNNIHGSIPSDCPHRERLGYTGDGQVCAPTAMMMLDSREFYRKWIQDILDCQDPVTGHVQHTAPLMGGGGGPGGWGCAIILVPWAYYLQYGEKALLEKCYEPMLRWISYLEKHSENHLIMREEEKGWCLGDWCTLEPTQIPEPFVNSCYLVKCLQILQEIAGILNRDVSALAALESKVTDALRDTYQDSASGSFCGSIQGADAYALWIGLGDQSLADRLAEKYDCLGHFDTGFLCTDILMEVLFDHSHADTALKLLESEEMGSYLYMKRHDATTLWESWEGAVSHNHPMFGACVRQLFTSILGIRWRADKQQLSIEPRIPQGLDRAEGTVRLPIGNVSASWQQSPDGITLQVTLPEGTTAQFRAGGKTVPLTPGENRLCW